LTGEPLSQIPKIMAIPVPGIAGIDGSKMVYGAWFLFNEAYWCLLNSQHFGAIVSLTASVELCLRSLLQEKSHDAKLVTLIHRARKKGFVTGEEEADLDNLRELRNHYVHFELEKLPMAKKVFETKLEDVVAGSVPDSMKATDAYPSEDYRYFIPLMAAVGLSGIYLQKVYTFYRRKYPALPSSPVLTHWKFKQVEFKQSGMVRMEKPPQTPFMAKLRRLLGRR
jgi:hypothetical protein